jgi:hypothetical protein
MRMADGVREALAQTGMVDGLLNLAEQGMSRAIVEGDVVLGIIGAVPTVAGVCEVFVVASEDQRRFPLAFTKAVRQELYQLQNKFRRIQAVSKNDEFHVRWLSWLGFKQEGLMRKYGMNGEDMLMWGLV